VSVVGGEMGCRGWLIGVVVLTGTVAGCGSTSTHAGGGPVVAPSSSTPGTRPPRPATTPPGPETTPPGASTTPATVAGQATTVVADCGSGAYQPARIVVTCADAAVVATEIRWSRWTVAAAAGTSVVQVDACRPTCAAQSAKPYGAHVALSEPVQTGQGPRFSHLTLTWTGPSPFGQASNSYPLATSM